MFDLHMERLRTVLLNSWGLEKIPEWLTVNTMIRGGNYSFLDHEYQEAVLRDPSPEKVVRKCSQIGISELAARYALALCNMIPGFTTIYTLPTAGFARTFTKTRVDTVIDESPIMKANLHTSTDNSEVKRFNNSFLYVKGTKGASAAISVPADAIFNDEVDFSDSEVMSNYQSRLTHSKYKFKFKWSTPTVEGWGISEHFESSRQKWNMVKCCHCNHYFVPDYFQHVRIPDFFDDMRAITKETIGRLRFSEAWLECPKCGKEPSLLPAHREWVIMNSESKHIAAGFQITPFDAPNIISLPFLIQASTSYDRYVDFINFNLGLPAEDKETSLTLDDFERCYVRGEPPAFGTTVMGVDMGMTCHFVIAGVDYTGRMTVVKTARVPLGQFEEKFKQFCAEYRVAMAVMDSYPYTDLLMRLQGWFVNLYGGIYTNTKDIEIFKLRAQEKDEDAGKEAVRQVNINRNKAFDSLMDFIRGGSITFFEDENKEELMKHCMDMKRIKEFTSDNEMAFVWKKSAKGIDHFHHALQYCYAAARLRGVSQNGAIIPVSLHKFRVKSAHKSPFEGKNT
jgi:hypothetical protein